MSGNDLEDDVQELWRIETNPTLIIRFRVATGLPIQGEIFNTSPYSDSKDDGPPLKKEYGHSLSFLSKEFLAPGFSRIEYSDAQSIGSLTGDNKDEDVLLRVLRDKQRNHKPHQLDAVDVTGKDTVKSNNIP
ncbi:hypothetical protein Tco_1557325, partial [Tanacetum coccineum]